MLRALEGDDPYRIFSDRSNCGTNKRQQRRGKGKGKAKERLLLRAKEAKAQVGHEKLPRQPQCCLRLLPHLDPLRGTSEC